MNPEDRSTLRRELRERRRALPATTRITAADSLADRLLALPFFDGMPVASKAWVAGYWAMDGEIGLHAFQMRLPAALAYCLPILHGIPEPDVAADCALEPRDMALVVLPLVGFDASGHRLGMGGGWYDRSFAFRHAQEPPPLLVGAAFDVQCVPALVAQAWDVRLDAVCSERATYLAGDRT